MRQDGTAYIICRGFCRCEFEAMEGAEILRKSIMVSRLSAFGVRMARPASGEENELVKKTPCNE